MIEKKKKKRNRTFNRELKTEELVDYKQCFFSETLKVVIEGFLLSLCYRYVELNIRYSDQYKKRQRSLQAYLRNRPKKVIYHLLMRKGAVDHVMMMSVEPINRNFYSVKSSDLKELKKNEYVVDFSNEQRYCSCTCPTCNDISQLFRDHVWINLDIKFFTLSSLTNMHLKSSNNTNSQTC